MKDMTDRKNITIERPWQEKVFGLIPFRHFIGVILLISLATAIRIYLLQMFQFDLSWLTFYPVVIMAEIYAGLYIGLLSIIFACLSTYFLPAFLINIEINYNPTSPQEIMSFVLICSLISCLIEINRRMRNTLKEQAVILEGKSERARFVEEIIDSMPSMIGYWDCDLHCQFANKTFSKWYKKRVEDIVGMSFQELAGDKLFALNEPLIQGVLAGEEQIFERTLKKPDGRIGHILAHYIPDFADDGCVKGFSIQGSEVTNLKETQADLQMAAYVFENTVDGVLITDASGIILSVNPAFIDITGYSAEEAVGDTPRLFKSNRHDKAFYEAMWMEITNQGKWSGEVWNRRKSGDLFLERLTISQVKDADGIPFRYISVFSDITDLWHKDNHLKHLAFYDALTDLPNRTLMKERIDQRIISCQRIKSRFALMFIDLDGFKGVNDQLGHATGDELLKLVAQRLKALVRQSDTVARLGGDEFIFVLNNAEQEKVILEVANRVLRSINKPMKLFDNTIEVGASIGIAIYPKDGSQSEDLINNADTAMYAAKQAGKNSIHFFSENQR